MASMITRSFFLVIILIHSVFCREYLLEELLVEAINNSKELKVMELELKKADYQVLEVTGKGMPQISGSLNFNHASNFLYIDEEKLQNSLNTNLQNSDISDKKLAGSIISQSLSLSGEMLKIPENSMIATLDIKQVLFAQGKVRLGIRAAKAHQRTLICKYNYEKMKLKSAIMISFYSAILAQKNVSICSEAVLLAEQTHRLAVITHLVGRASELDTLSSLYNLEKARLELQKSESSRKVVFQTIITQSGIPIEPCDFSVVGEFDEKEFKLSIDEVLSLVLRQNPNLIQLKGAREIQESLVNIARNDLYPSVYAGASMNGYAMFNRVSDLTGPGLGNEGRIYAGLNWDLFTGLSRIYKIRQAEADLDKFQFSEQQSTELLQLQARNAYEQVVQSKNNLMSTRSLISLAEKRYAIARKAFEVGSKTILDVQNAEFELNSAKMSLNAAQFSLQSAVISLRLLMSNL